MRFPFLPFPAGVRGALLSSPYGPRGKGFHNGVDVALPVGTPLLALGSGHVAYARTADLDASGLYVGYTTVLDGVTYTISYAHCSDILVKKGDKLTPAQPIALSGNSGDSSGPHLHLRIRTVNQPHLEPVRLLPFTC